MFLYRSLRHSALAFGLAAASAAASAAAQADDAPKEVSCEALAQSFGKTYFAFPEIKPGKVERLVSWRAACTEKPPKGDGNVYRLCQADLPEGGQVFYWLKTGVNNESSGYEICDE
ncbi:hypothetical protein CEG14_10930 [Bordetella genomosp. 1]|uniref:Uncharacterized protein n=1 Tax=Bordetella genomosp. 1 TaxID=1395607 RepID=A0A261SDU6_9BORD|nr:hypothetical protein [Bordetella genomosp. 1]OZI35579.1 hypothetical protein CEG14_10930 [Bordetella genomosp. 1]